MTKKNFCEVAQTPQCTALKMAIKLLNAVSEHGDLPIYIKSDDYDWWDGDVCVHKECEPREKRFPSDVRLPKRIEIG